MHNHIVGERYSRTQSTRDKMRMWNREREREKSTREVTESENRKRIVSSMYKCKWLPAALPLTM